MKMLNAACGKIGAIHGNAITNGAFIGMNAIGNTLIQNAGGDLAIQPA